MLRYLFDRLKPNSADVQELKYLRPLLRSLPKQQRIAIDVGANVGSITIALAHMGFVVYALEPHPQTRQRLAHAVGHLSKSGRVKILELAASDHDGTADLLVGSNDTVSTLEASWTTIAFPDYFADKRMIRVPTRMLSTLLPEQGVHQVGFLKIDVEGHETNVLRGTLTDRTRLEPPVIVMFEANQRFPEKAEECLAILAAHGYERFDVFVKEGPILLAKARFTGHRLPKEWRTYEGKYFYANIVAYHASVMARWALPDMPESR